jgi:hypothetical protein
MTSRDSKTTRNFRSSSSEFCDDYESTFPVNPSLPMCIADPTGGRHAKDRERSSQAPPSRLYRCLRKYRPRSHDVWDWGLQNQRRRVLIWLALLTGAEPLEGSAFRQNSADGLLIGLGLGLGIEGGETFIDSLAQQFQKPTMPLRTGT